MALTNTQKQDILYYLGYPSRTLDLTSTHYSNIVDSRLKNLPAEAETRIISIIAEIASTKTKLITSQNNMKVKRIGDIELNSNNENMLLKKDLKRLYKELADYLDIPYRGSVGNRNISVRY